MRSPLLLALVPAALAAQSAPVYTPGRLAPHQQLARDVYEEMVETNTVSITGSTAAAVAQVARRLRDAGFPEADIFVGGPAPAKQNLVLRIHGRGGPAAGKPVLLLAHLDVVDALKADWSADLDPFVLTERDGYFYGRGTSDDKAMASIFVANAIRLKREGWVPERDVIVALTADEEVNTATIGAEWLLKEHPALVDAGLVINEGGAGVLRDGKPLLNSVQATEKVVTNLTLRVTNRGGHSSVPRPDNAITTLSAALVTVGAYRFPIRLNDVTRAFFERSAASETPTMARAMRALARNPRDTAAARVVTRDPRYNSMLRTTCVATLLKAGHAENALPQLAEANVNCRMFPTETAAGTRQALLAAIGDTAVSIEIRTGAASASPAPSPLQPEVMGAIEQTTAELFGPIPVVPEMSTGATDSRFFRARGVPAYGVSGLFADPAVDARAHGRDERMGVKSYYEGQEFLYRLTKRLAGARPVP